MVKLHQVRTRESYKRYKKLLEEAGPVSDTLKVLKAVHHLMNDHRAYGSHRLATAAHESIRVLWMDTLPYNELPIYINSEYEEVKAVIQERLKKGV